MADRFVDDPSFQASEGHAQDERNVDGRVVDEVPVESLAVLPESLAVVGGQNEHRVVQHAAALQALAQHADERVRVGHLGVVGTVGILRPVGLGRRIGVVRLEQVDPQEEGDVPGLVEPGQGMLDRVRPLVLHLADVDGGLVRVELEVVAVVIEAAADSPARIQDEGADEPRRCPSARGQLFGERR